MAYVTSELAAKASSAGAGSAALGTWRFDFGKHSGALVSYVYQQHPDYIAFLIEKGVHLKSNRAHLLAALEACGAVRSSATAPPPPLVGVASSSAPAHSAQTAGKKRAAGAGAAASDGEDPDWLPDTAGTGQHAHATAKKAKLANASDKVQNDDKIFVKWEGNAEDGGGTFECTVQGSIINGFAVSSADGRFEGETDFDPDADEWWHSKRDLDLGAAATATAAAAAIAAAAIAAAAVAALDVDSLKVGELRAELAKLGLSTKGKKADLQTRLHEAITSAADDDGVTLLLAPASADDDTGAAAAGAGAAAAAAASVEVPVGAHIALAGVSGGAVLTAVQAIYDRYAAKKVADLQTLLKINQQRSTGEKGNNKLSLVQRCVDREMFGALPECDGTCGGTAFNTVIYADAFTFSLESASNWRHDGTVGKVSCQGGFSPPTYDGGPRPYNPCSKFAQSVQRLPWVAEIPTPPATAAGAVKIRPTANFA